MANGSDWTAILTEQGWIDSDGNLVSPGEAILRIILPQGRTYNVRTGKAAARARIVGEFLVVQEHNIDSAGRSRVTTVALSAIESIDSVV